MKVELSDRTLREMQRLDFSWRARASSPDVYHLYLARKSDDLIVVVSIWSARRRRGPTL